MDGYNCLIINEDERRQFARSGDLTNFLVAETMSWEWLRNLSFMKEVGEHAYQLFVGGPLEAVLQEIKDDPDSSLRSVGTLNSPIILAESAEGLLIKRAIHKWGEQVAFILFLYILPANRKTAKEDSALVKYLTHQQNEFEKAIAFNLIAEFYGATVSVNDSKSDEIHAMLSNLARRADEVISETEKRTEVANKNVQLLRRNLDAFTQDIARKYRRKAKAWHKYSNLVSQHARKTLDASREKMVASSTNFDEAQRMLESASTAYLDQLDLSSAVKYWRNRAISHSIFKWTWLIGVLLSMGLTLGAMGLYFDAGGVAGISKTLKELIVSATAANAPATTNTGVIDALSQTSVLLLMANIAGATLLLTLLAVIIKIALRQFNVHSQCAIESAERVIFTKTYLALMRDGHLNVESDRRLVLDALFRQNQITSTTEVNFSPPVEQMLKGLSDNLKITAR